MALRKVEAEPETGPTLATARADVERLRTEAATLRALTSGTIESTVMRRERHSIIRPTGVEVVEVDVPYIESRPIGALERLQARRKLGAVEEELLAAEEALALALVREAAAARERRATAIAEGAVALRRLAPALFSAVREAQRLAVAWHAEIERVDAQIGDGHFTSLAGGAPLMPGQVLSGWIEHVSQALEPPR